MLMNFQPTALSLGTVSVSLSTNRNGARCGSTCWICSISRVTPEFAESAMVALLGARAGKLAHRVNLPQPFLYRFCRNPAIILSAFDHLAADAGGARRQPGAGTDSHMIRDPDLAAQHGEIADRGTPADAALRHQDAVPADFDIVANLNEIIELAAFSDHR